ncbi:SRPBCC family protein [Flavobacterium selenitireducens]|uniref:SRPBCC family protein n=1 Tax=Flavobacterium selenitireducens TaxID=2722704 RepID=UPI00168AF0D2|nr:SRPBCC domain-containing protein [Flavobacterium selenitireducens]MBD3582247.1 SRPBCC domain-containing protein [Flavobacterium selenitireducens]
MESQYFMSFNVEKANKKIVVKREFGSRREMVWKAWTTSDALDKWWAPKPYKAITESMDFTVGGFWLYYMLGPEGDRHWARVDYRAINPLSSFAAYDAFCDEEGNINGDLPRTVWHVDFSDKGKSTLVEIVLEFDKLGDLEQTLEMGFQEGFTMGLSNLDELLEKKDA